MGFLIMSERVHISHGITKLGADIPSVSFPPVITCDPNAPCFKKCYARRGRFAFPHNKDLLQKNLDLWKSDPSGFFFDVKFVAFHSRFFRYFSSGDIPDMEFFIHMTEVARELPDTQFLAFTKKTDIVNTYIDANGELPPNLHIVFSAWGSWLPHNPYNLPVAYIRFKKGDNSMIPTDARPCQRFCGDCVMTGCSCWDLQKGESVCFTEH